MTMVTFQALAQCENTLTKLGVIREAVDDTAGAAQVVLNLVKRLSVNLMTTFSLKYRSYQCLSPTEDRSSHPFP